MKLFSHSKVSSPASQPARAGFTLVEVMITVLLMGMVIAGILSAQFVGLREDQLMESKAGISDKSRKAISQMLYDIKSAKGYFIGNGTASNFIALTNGNSMQGTALQLFTTVMSSNQAINLTNYITTYYFDTNNVANNDGILWRQPAGSSTPTVVASNLINSFTFTSEFYTGGVQTVRTYKGVVHTTLQFEQFQYPLTTVGTNGIYDYYRIDCRATPHLPDGP